jgi:hypothetical protein
VTRQELAAELERLRAEDPIEWVRMRQQITAVEEADREDGEG